MTPETPSPFLKAQVERFAKSFADLLKETTEAVQEAALDPARSSTPALLVWQTRALPMLEAQNASIQKGVALFQIGETQTILKLADDAHGLDKQLDGYPLDFAGPKHAEAIDRLETAIVVAAYQLRNAARAS